MNKKKSKGILRPETTLKTISKRWLKSRKSESVRLEMNRKSVRNKKHLSLRLCRIEDHHLKLGIVHLCLVNGHHRMIVDIDSLKDRSLKKNHR